MRWLNTLYKSIQERLGVLDDEEAPGPGVVPDRRGSQVGLLGAEVADAIDEEDGDLSGGGGGGPVAAPIPREEFELACRLKKRTVNFVQLESSDKRVRFLSKFSKRAEESLTKESSRAERKEVREMHLLFKRAADKRSHHFGRNYMVEHDLPDGSARVLVWNKYEDVVKGGHLSILFRHGQEYHYISLCTRKGGKEPLIVKTFTDDCKGREGVEADYIIQVDGLNTQAICDELKRLRIEPGELEQDSGLNLRYRELGSFLARFFKQDYYFNCSSLVMHLLLKGGIDRILTSSRYISGTCGFLNGVYVGAVIEPRPWKRNVFKMLIVSSIVGIVYLSLLLGGFLYGKVFDSNFEVLDSLKESGIELAALGGAVLLLSCCFSLLCCCNPLSYCSAPTSVADQLLRGAKLPGVKNIRFFMLNTSAVSAIQGEAANVDIASAEKKLHYGRSFMSNTIVVEIPEAASEDASAASQPSSGDGPQMLSRL